MSLGNIKKMAVAVGVQKVPQKRSISKKLDPAGSHSGKRSRGQSKKTSKTSKPFDARTQAFMDTTVRRSSKQNRKAGPGKKATAPPPSTPSPRKPKQAYVLTSALARHFKRHPAGRVSHDYLHSCFGPPLPVRSLGAKSAGATLLSAAAAADFRSSDRGAAAAAVADSVDIAGAADASELADVSALSSVSRFCGGGGASGLGVLDEPASFVPLGSSASSSSLVAPAAARAFVTTPPRKDVVRQFNSAQRATAFAQNQDDIYRRLPNSTGKHGQRTSLSRAAIAATEDALIDWHTQKHLLKQQQKVGHLRPRTPQAVTSSQEGYAWSYKNTAQLKARRAIDVLVDARVSQKARLLLRRHYTGNLHVPISFFNDAVSQRVVEDCVSGMKDYISQNPARTREDISNRVKGILGEQMICARLQAMKVLFIDLNKVKPNFAGVDVIVIDLSKTSIERGVFTFVQVKNHVHGDQKRAYEADIKKKARDARKGFDEIRGKLAQIKALLPEAARPLLDTLTLEHVNDFLLYAALDDVRRVDDESEEYNESKLSKSHDAFTIPIGTHTEQMKRMLDSVYALLEIDD